MYTFIYYLHSLGTPDGYSADTFDTFGQQPVRDGEFGVVFDGCVQVFQLVVSELFDVSDEGLDFLGLADRGVVAGVQVVLVVQAAQLLVVVATDDGFDRLGAGHCGSWGYHRGARAHRKGTHLPQRGEQRWSHSVLQLQVVESVVVVDLLVPHVLQHRFQVRVLVGKHEVLPRVDVVGTELTGLVHPDDTAQVRFLSL